MRRLRLGFEKKNERRIQSFILGRCLELSVLLVALSAVDRFTRCRHKWHLRICAAVRTFDLRHLPRGTVASIPITHFVFHRPYSLVIRDDTRHDNRHELAAQPSSTQVRSQVYCRFIGGTTIKLILCPSFVLGSSVVFLLWEYGSLAYPMEIRKR